MSGLSGASIAIYDDYVDKRGPRCRIQGEWLLSHPHLPVPKIHYISMNGYGMELLQEVKNPVSLEEIMIGLNKFWSCKPKVKHQPIMTVNKILDLTSKYKKVLGVRRSGILHIATNVIGAGSTGLTHGDPTYENLLFRENELVFCDPLPATGAIPDIIEVDLGKLLQSALGWETKVKQVKGPAWTCEDVLNCGERRIIIGWAVIHLLRTLPYSTNHTAILELIDAALDL